MGLGKVALAVLTGGISLALPGMKKDSAPAPTPAPLPTPPKPEAAGAKAEDVVRKKKAAMTQSIYTSPLGIAGEAQVARKTLLGQ